MAELTKDEIKDRLNKSLNKLYIKDWYLLRYNVHERSITHKLAEYLQELFPDYDVDCEYDRDIDNADGNFKKQIHGIVTEELRKRKNSIITIPQDGWIDNDKLEEYINDLRRNFYPDIIVHKRGTNSHNLLIIEAKKANVNVDFDKKKLTAYTKIDFIGNRLNYKLGVLLQLSIGERFSREEVKITDYPITNKPNNKRAAANRTIKSSRLRDY